MPSKHGQEQKYLLSLFFVLQGLSQSFKAPVEKFLSFSENQNLFLFS